MCACGRATACVRLRARARARVCVCVCVCVCVQNYISYFITKFHLKFKESGFGSLTIHGGSAVNFLFTNRIFIFIKKICTTDSFVNQKMTFK